MIERHEEKDVPTSLNIQRDIIFVCSSMRLRLMVKYRKVCLAKISDSLCELYVKATGNIFLVIFLLKVIYFLSKLFCDD